MIGAISPQLERAEIERAKRKPTESLQAYDYYLRALACVYRSPVKRTFKRSSSPKRPSASIPNSPYHMRSALVAMYKGKVSAGESILLPKNSRGRRLARRALELDKDDPQVLALAGATLAFVVGEVEEGAALGARAITLDPNLAAARYWGGWAHLYLGDVDAAIEQFEIALRLSPLDPRFFSVQTGLAYAHFFAGRNEEASTWATRALRQQPNYRTAQFILAACHAMSGRIEEAREICARPQPAPTNFRLGSGPHFAGRKISTDWRRLSGSRGCRNDRYWHGTDLPGRARHVSYREQSGRRVGINVGDVIVEPHDVFGDDVNIAARLESVAEPGGVYISSSAYDHIRGKVGIEFVDLGEQLLKNIARPVRAYAAILDGRGPTTEVDGLGPIPLPPPLPDKPSIAVLPFENLSGDPEQEYFADGMVDEITTALSRFKSLFVIGRNSSFTYKGKAVDIKQVGRALGVRYVLEGSVRKAAGKVRIIGQLIDAATGVHLWADRFEGDLSDIFTLQDRMTESVVSAIEPKVFQTEIDLAARRPNSLSAYDLCLRAIPHLYSFTRGGSAEALRLVSRALKVDPRYGFAATVAGSCHIQNVTQGWAADPKSETAEGLRLLRLALSIDGNDHVALSMLGYAAAWSGDFDTASEMVDLAVALNPNAAFAWSTEVGPTE